MIAWLLVLALDLPLDLPKVQAFATLHRTHGTNPRPELEQALRLARERSDRLSEAWVRAGIVALEEHLGRYQRAEQALSDAVTPEVRRMDPAFSARVALWLAEESTSRPPRVRRWARWAAGEFRGAPGPQAHRAGLARALHLEAKTYSPGPEREALLKEALVLAEGAARAQVQADWGEFLRQAGDLAGAIRQLEAASATLRSSGQADEAGHALTLLARAYFAHGQRSEALARLREADRLIGGQMGPNAVQSRLELARILAANGDRAGARALLAGLEQLPFKLTQVHAALLAHCYLNLGEPQRVLDLAVQHNYANGPALYWIVSAAHFALGRYEKARQAATDGVNRSRPYSMPRISAHHWRARALDRLGRHAEAADDMHEVARFVRGVLDRLAPDDEWKRAFNDARQEVADDMVAIFWRANRREEALEIGENLRARAFLDLLASRNAEGDRWTAPDSAEPRLSSTALAAPITLEQIREHVKTPLISYFAHPEALYVWVVTPAGAIHSARVPVTKARLAALATRGRKLDYAPDRDTWRELHRWLIQPVSAWIPKGKALTLLPHGPLWQIPFAALLGPDGRYLLEDHAVRLLPAAGFLWRQHPAASGPLLLAGDPRSPLARNGQALAALPGARREILSIAALRPGVQRLTGASAQVEDILRALPGAGEIHFATHAVVDPGAPFASYLALSGPSRLTVAQIYAVPLTARLVVLSACRGGSGRASTDGLLGFVRAFLYAGAATVVAPLWDVPDETTVVLMEDLYRQRRKVESQSEALRRAQLKVLAELRAGRMTAMTPAGAMRLPEHPGLWAGFVLQGAD